MAKKKAAKKKAAKKETKSDFLRKVLGKDPGLELHQANRLWAKKGHEGEISGALYYQVRRTMGIKSVWGWFPAEPAPQAKGPKPAGTPGPAYRLKVTLRDVRSPIWRRLLVPDCSLYDLHEILQVVMGWHSCHLFNFEVGDALYTDPQGADSLEMDDASRVRLSDVVPKEKFKFLYTYDFGDTWEHEILVEKILPSEEGRKGPVCLDGARSGPPEDVGGPWGYADYVEAIRDPEHARHDELVEWGGEFDPEAFSPDAVNEQLKRLR